MSPRRSWAVARNDLRILRSDPVFFIVFTAMPLVLMAFVKPSFRFALIAAGQKGANGAEQAVPGIAVMFSLFLVGNVGFTFFREHGWGTWDRLRCSSCTSIDLIVGKSVAPLVQSFAQLAILFGVGGVIYDLTVRGSFVGLILVAISFDSVSSHWASPLWLLLVRSCN